MKLEVINGDKKEPCPYCGKPPHEVPLACPRIESVTIYQEGDSMEIHFWPEDDEPKLAG